MRADNTITYSLNRQCNSLIVHSIMLPMISAIVFSGNDPIVGLLTWQVFQTRTKG